MKLESEYSVKGYYDLFNLTEDVQELTIGRDIDRDIDSRRSEFSCGHTHTHTRIQPPMW